MDIRRIRQFVVLAETLNFRHAAERLHMAQPPLSVAIQKLEAELGVPLFERGPRGVKITESGKAALVEARRMLFHAERFSKVAEEAALGEAGVLRVGFVGTVTYGWLPRIIPLFRAEFPNVELVLREATSEKILQYLEEEEMDVGLIRVPIAKTTKCRLLPVEVDGFVLALNKSNPLAKKRRVALADLADQPFIFYSAHDAPGLHMAAMIACQHGGFVPKVAQVAVQVQTLLSLVESGLGVALVPRVGSRFASDQVVFRPVADMPEDASIGISLAYQPESETANARRFRELVQDRFGAR